MCKYDKVAIARDVATRAFDNANVTAENCHAIQFEALKQAVDKRLSDSCPLPDVSFIHHLPHAGSTVLASMLESIDSVRMWSEYAFASELSVYAEMVDKSDQQKVIKTLIQLLACSPRGATKVRKMVIKLDSRTSAMRMDNFRDIFPSSPWLFLFRQPHEVLASACPEPAAGCHLGALGGQNVTPAHVFKYLETLMGRGIMTLRRSHVDGLGKAVDYGTLSKALASDVDVILGHLRLSASAQERAAMAEVVGYDIKASKKQRIFVPFDRVDDASRKKAITEASPEVTRFSSKLDPIFAELLQLAAPVVAETGWLGRPRAAMVLSDAAKLGEVAPDKLPSNSLDVKSVDPSFYDLFGTSAGRHGHHLSVVCVSVGCPGSRADLIPPLSTPR